MEEGILEEQLDINMTSSYFKRFKRECEKLSKHIKFKRIKHGFYRIYYKNLYIHECSSNMPCVAVELDEENPMVYESKQFYEEYEDNIDMIKRFKNYIEGYYDAIDVVRRRVWMRRHDDEFNKITTEVMENYNNHG